MEMNSRKNREDLFICLDVDNAASSPISYHIKIRWPEHPKVHTDKRHISFDPVRDS